MNLTKYGPNDGSNWSQMSSQGVFYITGRGGSLENGLGSHLAEVYGVLSGLSLSADWFRRPHEEQVALVGTQLADAAAARSPVIANSYGSYLVVLALLDAPPLDTSVMLLSPVLGKAVIGGTYHRPPGGKSFAAALNGQIAKPSLLELYIGEADPHYAPATWGKLGAAIKPDRQEVLVGEGHSLSKDLVAGLVSNFMQRHAEAKEV